MRIISENNLKNRTITEMCVKATFLEFTNTTSVLRKYFANDQIKRVRFPQQLCEICSNMVLWRAWRTRFTTYVICEGALYWVRFNRRYVSSGGVKIGGQLSIASLSFKFVLFLILFGVP